jgi:3'-phosphoadenosine 5'-phosphosulfate (PAPS) 3'-phosphatase
LGEVEDYGAIDSLGSTYLGRLDGNDGEALAGLSSASSLEELHPIHVSMKPPDGTVRVCLSYEKAHSDKDRTSTALDAAGLEVVPIRIDSQCKYAMVASGRADLYLRLARGEYREKAWDHAAGAAVVRAAGGLAEDMTGEELAFPGRLLQTHGGICVRTPAIDRPSLD